MVLQFLHSFGKVLRLDINPNMLSLSDLQEGLLNIGDNMGKVQDLLVNMLSAAVCDPGVPAGHKVRICQSTLEFVGLLNCKSIPDSNLHFRHTHTHTKTSTRLLRWIAFHSQSSLVLLLDFLHSSDA